MSRLWFLVQACAISFVSFAPRSDAACTLCPDGSEIAHPHRIIPALGLAGIPHPTCKEAAAYAQNAASIRICQSLQAQAAYCGCPGSEPHENSCQFCENGEPPEFAQQETAMKATCDDLNDYVSHLTHEQCETERGQSILRNGFLCGCPFSAAACALCPDGTIDIKNPNLEVPFFNLDVNHFSPTCQEVAEAAAITSPASMNCELIKQQAGFCGCKNMEPRGHCHFCPGGGVPTKLNGTTHRGDTCQALYDYMEFLPEKDCEDSHRIAAIQSNAYACGCPHVQAHCTLCEDGKDPQFPDRRAAANGQTCGEASFEVESHTAETCENERENIAALSARCGCEGAEFPVCTVQMGAELCSYELLNTTDAQCECYSFCDGEFLQCHDFPGGRLSNRKCQGEKVSGCNRALAELNRLSAEKLSTEDEETAEESSGSRILVRVGWFAVVGGFLIQ